MTNIAPIIEVVAALTIDRLTTPDSEDWTIILDGAFAHVAAYREVLHNGERRVCVMRGTSKLRELKSSVRTLPPDHDLGCVTVIVPTDAVDPAAKFIAWMTRMARTKNFSVTSFIGTVPTAEAVQVFKAWGTDK